MIIKTPKSSRVGALAARFARVMVCAIAYAAITVVALPAQLVPARTSPSEAFEVASVKENRSGDGQRSVGFQQGGRFRARNMTVRGIIAAAYGSPQPLPLFRVIGGASWIDSDRYDVEANASADAASSLTPWPPRGQAMLRALLVDRFKLVARQETRELPAYELRLANEDRTLGPQLHQSTGADCVDPKSTTAAPAGAGAPAQIACGGFRFTPPERLSARFLTMDELARFIMLNIVERPVVNRTGLNGHFSIEVDYTRALTAPTPGAADANEPLRPTGTSIFTAVREQLGLKLEPTKAPTDVVVIDAIDRPTSN
jgi:uncharacterized protein (TIGR03435 family)